VLGGGIRRPPHEAVTRGKTGDVDDGAFTSPAHGGKYRAGHEEEAPEVGRHGRVPLLEREVPEGTGDQHPRVVDQHPDLAEGSHDPLHRSGRLHRIAHIRRVARGRDPLLLELSHQSVHLHGGPRAHTDPIPGAAESEGGGAADPLGRTSDEGGDAGRHGEF
jgi:hypothetical protein